jgi:hypothetical protein
LLQVTLPNYLANGDAVGLPGLPVLGAIAFAPAWEGNEAEARQGVIPQNFAVLARRANEGVNGAL